MSEYVTQVEFQQLRGALEGARDAMQAVQAFALRPENRSPSKAYLQGGGRSVTAADAGGAWLAAIANARSSDATQQASGKAALEFMESRYVDADAMKATLGTSGAVGGFIMPNAMVDRLITISTAANIYRQIIPVVSGVNAPAINIPVEASAATRAVVAAWGTLKANEDIGFASYTATFYTLAKIHDVANQLLRYSAGAAEQEVTDRLGKSIGLGEAYYILQGAGTTEPVGLLTALNTSGNFDTTKSAATTTIATSIAGTIISGIKALAKRAVAPTAIVLDPTSYWTAMTEATTSFAVLGSLAGQAVAPLSVSGVDGSLRLFGLPLLSDANMPVNTGIVGDYSAARLYVGSGYRVDTSSEAGTRWDQNLTGFRGEEEIAFCGTPYVVAGKFQRLTNLNT
jgi:HK97 family phage major capsid protein